jgi:hypothetical protein
MPESTSRRKSAPKKEAVRPAIVGEEQGENPTWYKVTMFGLMIIGLLWILVFYISSAQYPLGSASFLDLSNWNILIGFGIAMIGFVMTTKWK